MLELTHILAFNLMLLAAWITPGPALMLALKNTLTGGRAAGVATGVGLAIVAALWTAAALLGLDIVFELFPATYVAVKTLGAAYLIYLAWTMWRDAKAPLAPAPDAQARAFRSGLILNVTNPKAVLFAAAVLVVIFPPTLTAGEKMLIVFNHLIIEVLAYGLFAWLVGAPAVGRGYLRLKPVFDRAAGTVMGALGLRLLLDRESS